MQNRVWRKAEIFGLVMYFDLNLTFSSLKEVEEEKVGVLSSEFSESKNRYGTVC